MGHDSQNNTVCTQLTVAASKLSRSAQDVDGNLIGRASAATVRSSKIKML